MGRVSRDRKRLGTVACALSIHFMNREVHGDPIHWNTSEKMKKFKYDMERIFYIKMWNGSSTYTHIVHYLNNRHMGCYHTHDKLDLKPQVSGLFFFLSLNGNAYMERSQNSLESPIKQNSSFGLH